MSDLTVGHITQLSTNENNEPNGRTWPIIPDQKAVSLQGIEKSLERIEKLLAKLLESPSEQTEPPEPPHLWVKLSDIGTAGSSEATREMARRLNLQLEEENQKMLAEYNEKLSQYYQMIEKQQHDGQHQ